MNVENPAKRSSPARGIARITPLAAFAGLATGAAVLLVSARPAVAPARSRGAASPISPARRQPTNIHVGVDPHDSLYPGANLSGMILAGTILIGIDGGIDLHEARRRRACLWRCDGRRANVEGCDLRDAILLACRLDGASFRGA